MPNAHCEQSQKRNKQTILIYIENTKKVCLGFLA